MEILNKLKKIQSEIETANQSAYDSKQEIENLEYNLSQAGDYADDVSNYLEDVGRDVEGMIETLEDDLAIMERAVVIKSIIELVNMLPEIDRLFAVSQVSDRFLGTEKQEIRASKAKLTTEETAAEETKEEN